MELSDGMSNRVSDGCRIAVGWLSDTCEIAGGRMYRSIYLSKKAKLIILRLHTDHLKKNTLIVPFLANKHLPTRILTLTLALASAQPYP